MPFAIDFYPRCTHHVFLSHSGADKATLILPVYERLRARGIEGWVDRHDFAYGRDSLTALDDGVLNCRHVVFFLTPAMLANPKGWCQVELAYADLIQRNLRTPSLDLVNVILPLLFVPKDTLAPTVWRTVSDRGQPHDPNRHPDAVGWAAEAIERFLRIEQGRAKQLEARRKRDDGFQRATALAPGLRERVTKFHPRPLPAEPPV